LSLERFIEITDTKKRLDKYSEKFKIWLASLYVTLLWIAAILFSLPMIVSTTLNHDVNFKPFCDSKWNQKQLNQFFFIEFVFSFILPFAIIVFSSSKLLIFLNNWKKQSVTFKLKNSAKYEIKSSLIGKKGLVNYKIIKIILIGCSDFLR